MTITVTDLFCGAGGSSLGAELAGGTLRLGLNHWERAVETHATNFQDADHDCEDVSSLTTARIRGYPASDVLLASPECTNHSLAKGARRRKTQGPNLFSDGPAGDAEQDRSRATMWDVCRFAEQMHLKGRPYKCVVVENVVDAYKWGYNDDGGLFAAWLCAMQALGYRYEIMWLNSMFCPPTPQSRDRMYVVFWLKEMRAPNLRVEPVSWCPRCERAVEGRQTFKRTDRPAWGRYGAQYFYTCPTCYGTVLPGVFPAASIIDPQVPATAIGERERPLAKNTRERIRRGLERLAREPFAIRLLHSQAPRPLTLPLVTTTTRRDMAMVLPVAGNTHESTPGNRARDAITDPLATLHATLDRALVMITRTAHRGANGYYSRDAVTDPAYTLTRAHDLAMVASPANTQNGVPRPANSEPSQTLRTEGGLSLVYANRANGLARPATEQPAQAVCTGGHLGVIVSNYGPGPGGWARPAGELPTGSLTARDGHALLVPYMNNSRPILPDREPGPTLTTRDRLALVVPPTSEALDDLGTPTEASPPVTDAEIDACLFRMFVLREIAGAMSMRYHTNGEEYVVLGNRREQGAQYGGAVTPPAMRRIFSRLLPILDEAS